MGLLSWLLEKRMKDPVGGTGKVLAMDPEAVGPVWDAQMHTNVDPTSAGYVMDCEVSAPGLNPTAVRHEGSVSVSQWPSIGATLPIVVDRTKPKRFVIKWDRL